MTDDRRTPGGQVDGPAVRGSGRGSAQLVAALVCAVHALGLTVVAGLYARELFSGEATEPSTAAMALTLTGIFAVLLWVVTRAWLQGARWPRTPTIVWCLLTLPVAWTLGTTAGPAVGLALAGVSLAGLAAGLLSPGPDQPEERDTVAGQRSTKG